jgi:hypothetical protein
MHEHDSSWATGAAEAGNAAAVLTDWLRGGIDPPAVELLTAAHTVAGYALHELLAPPAPAAAEPAAPPRKPKRPPKVAVPVGKPAQAARLEAFFAQPSTATPAPALILALALHLEQKLLERFVKSQTS